MRSATALVAPAEHDVLGQDGLELLGIGGVEGHDHQGEVDLVRGPVRGGGAGLVAGGWVHRLNPPGLPQERRRSRRHHAE